MAGGHPTAQKHVNKSLFKFNPEGGYNSMQETPTELVAILVGSL